MKKKLAIVGIFWDGYYDLWEDFLELKERFWKDCPYPTYIVNQTRDLAYKKEYDVTVIHAGKDAEYSKKVQVALNEIDADYYLLLLEDFFFSKNLLGAVLDDKLSFMVNNDLLYYAMPLEEFHKSIRGSKFQNSQHILNIDTTSEYTVNCQPAIWEREFLKKCIGSGNYNAWVFEGIYIYSKEAHTTSFLSHCKLDMTNILGLKHGALQGKMVPDTIQYYKSIGYSMNNSRGILDNSKYRLNKIKVSLKGAFPLKFQRLIKKIIKSPSVIDKYRDDILKEMELMDLQ